MSRRGFAARPSAADAWVKTAEPLTLRRAAAAGFTARLTIDVTPALRGRLKVAAFQRGETMTDLVRALLERAFPEPGGDT